MWPELHRLWLHLSQWSALSLNALELLGMTLAHLKDAEARAEMSPRVALLMAIRDRLALGLREER